MVFKILILCAWIGGRLPLAFLLNLEAAWQGRSVLFSDEQKLLFEEGEKGFTKNTKFDFLWDVN
jgi:hypothetical protein